MPVRSLSSSVIVWPSAGEVEESLVEWAHREARIRPGLCGVGYYGSYATGNWGVGSDLDIVLVVEKSEKSVGKRTLEWELAGFQVPVDLCVYTLDEWHALSDSSRRFARMLLEDTKWVYRKKAHAHNFNID